MQQSHLLNIKRNGPQFKNRSTTKPTVSRGLSGGRDYVGVMIIVHVFWPILVFSKLCGSMDRNWFVLKVEVLFFGSTIFEHRRQKILEIYLMFVRSGVDDIEFSGSFLFWFNPHGIETKEMV